MHTYLKCGIRAASILCALFAATAFAAPAPKVDLCHKTGNGYNSISVSGNAVSSHLAHGDVVMPNGTVPGSPGFVFDKNCNVVGWIYATNATVDASAQSGGVLGSRSGRMVVPPSDTCSR